MTDEFKPQDEEIIQHLKALSQTSAEYPANSLKKRRKSFRKEARGLLIAVPLAGFLKSPLSFLTQVPAKTLEFVLVGVLLAEVGLSAYVFRDQIRDWLSTETSTPVILQSTWTPQPTQTETPTPTQTATLPVPTSTQKTPPTNQGFHFGQTKTPKP